MCFSFLFLILSSFLPELSVLIYTLHIYNLLRKNSKGYKQVSHQVLRTLCHDSSF